MALKKDIVEKGKPRSVTTTVTPYRKKRVTNWSEVGGWAAGIGTVVICILVFA